MPAKRIASFHKDSTSRRLGIRGLEADIGKEHTDTFGRALIAADLVATFLRDSAPCQREATPQILSKGKNNKVALFGQLFYSTRISLSRKCGNCGKNLDHSNAWKN